MKFDINFSKYINNQFQDHWKWEVVEAKDEEEAKQKILEKHNRDGKKVNYFLSVTPLESK